MNKFSIALIVLFYYCISCVKINPIEIENGNIIIGESNVLICNEGGFQNGNASSSIYNKEENTISNDLYQSVNISVAIEALTVLIKLLAPFAPHMAEEIWLKLGGEGSIHNSKWPSVDKQALLVESYDLVIQVKGKVRGRIEVSISANKQEIEEIVLKSEISEKWLKGKKPSRIIVIPGKLVNLVP